MGSPWLGIASGLSQGLATGIQQGANLAAQKQQLELQKQQASAASLTALQNATKITDPAMRKLAFQRLLPGIGIDANSDTGKQWIDAVSKASDESLANARDLFQQALGINMDARTVGDIMTNHPELLVNLASQVQSRKATADILAGLPQNPDLAQTQGTSDMGTGTVGAGGAAGAPAVGGAGTSPSGTQPAASPAPSAAAPGAATVAAPPAQGAPIQPGTPTTPAPTSGVPAPTSQAPSVLVGKSHDGRDAYWNPNNSDYVIALNNIMDKLLVAPGDHTDAIAAIKDRRTQYIEGQKLARSDWLAMQNLQVSRGHLSIAQADHALAENRFSFDVAKDRRDYEFKVTTDLRDFNFKSKNDIRDFEFNKFKDSRDFEFNTFKDTLDRELAQGRLTVEQANQKLNEKQYELARQKFEEEPRSPLARARFGQGQPTGPTAGPAVSAPSPTEKAVPTPTDAIGKPLSQIGKDNGDGTWTIDDQSIASSVDLGKDNRLIYDEKRKGFFIQTPTPTSLRTNEALDQAQMGVDSTRSGLNLTAKLKDVYKDSPTTFGYVGAAKASIQTGIGVAKDIAKLIPQTQAFLDWTGLKKLPYDPNSPTMEGLSEVLNAYVTKALAANNSGLSAYATNAKNVKDLTNLLKGSSEEVAAHIDVIEQILSDSNKAFMSHLPTGSTSGVPDPTKQQAPALPPAQQQALDQLAKQPKAPSKSWSALTLEERTPYVDTIHDGNASKFVPLKGHTTYYAKIPNGDILKLKLGLQAYPTPEGQANIRKQFNTLYGNGADAEVGYPP